MEGREWKSVEHELGSLFRESYRDISFEAMKRFVEWPLVTVSAWKRRRESRVLMCFETKISSPAS